MPKKNIHEWNWKSFEELFQCPVCLEPPLEGVIMQCNIGHHVCQACQQKLIVCPLCKSKFTGTRNYIAEGLMQNFSVMKDAITLLLTGEVRRKRLKRKEPAPKKVSYTISIDKGLFPCRFERCDAKLPMARLLNHCRTFHETALEECKIDDEREFKMTWQFTFDDKKPITRMTKVVFVSGIGLVFLNIEILRSGHVIAVAQMGAKLTNCQNFKVTLKIHKDRLSYVHTTSMNSCREEMTNLLHGKACLLLSRNSISSVLDNKKFNCTIEIRPNPGRAFLVEPEPSMRLIKNVHAQRDLMFAEERKITKKKENKNVKGDKDIVALLKKLQIL